MSRGSNFLGCFPGIAGRKMFRPDSPNYLCTGSFHRMLRCSDLFPTIECHLFPRLDVIVEMAPYVMLIPRPFKFYLSFEMKSVQKEKYLRDGWWGERVGKPVHLLTLYCQFAILAGRHKKKKKQKTFEWQRRTCVKLVRQKSVYMYIHMYIHPNNHGVLWDL